MKHTRETSSSAKNCKIVATVGPSSNSPERLALLVAAGVNVFRINFSHGDSAAHAAVIDTIRRLEDQLGHPIGVLADLQGPKIRVGTFEDGELDLAIGEEIELRSTARQNGERFIPVAHPEIFEASEPGDQLLFDDGKIIVQLTSVGASYATAKVLVPGVLKDKKGLNVPGKRLPISAITEKDRNDLAVALAAGADFVALSFVQHPDDVREARDLIGDKAGILVKIEKPSALEHLSEILELADAAMVARGDLGVELPPEQVPIYQRRIVREARRLGRPVIVATQMLESMVESPTPTRAEASDVATAVYQGADAVMLSAESAVGRHPSAVVAIMDRIIRAIEGAPDYADTITIRTTQLGEATADAISLAATNIANELKCAAIVAFTSTGSTAKRISRARPFAPILMLTPEITTARRGCLMWGVTPFVKADIDSYESMMETAKLAASEFDVEDGDRIVVTAGFPFGRPGKTNLVQVTRVGET